MCFDASLSSPEPNVDPVGDLVRGHRRPSAFSQSGVMDRWWGGVGEQALGGGSWRAVWRRAPRTTGATSRPPALRGAIRYTRSPQYVRYLFRGWAKSRQRPEAGPPGKSRQRPEAGPPGTLAGRLALLNGAGEREVKKLNLLTLPVFWCLGDGPTMHIICGGSAAQLCTGWRHLHAARTQYYQGRLAQRLRRVMGTGRATVQARTRWSHRRLAKVDV